MTETKPGDPKYAEKRPGVSNEDLHKEMLERHKMAREYWQPQYDKAREDMEFAFTPESQWDKWMAESRKGRPCYSVNKVRQAMKQITNDQRQNRPQAKVRAVEDGDAELAEIRQGILRNIDSASDAERACDTAFQFAVGGGFGVWRINTAYEDDGGFDQVIIKEEIANPYSVTFDPASKNKDRRDARFAFVDTTLSRGEFRSRWPKAKLVSVDSTTELDKDWWDEKEVVAAEYWYKTTEQVQIVLMSDGSVYDVDEELESVRKELAAQGVTEQRRRWVDRTKVWHSIVSGAEILEGPNEWAGRFIPLIPVWGEILTLKGREIFFGAVRFAKDAQRMYNYERSTFIEVLADQPYSPFMADVASIKGYEAQYQGMRTNKPPVLLYNGDASKPNGGKPSREMPPAFPAALAQAAQISSDDIKAATGIYDASLGARSNETSGRAIIARQREGDVANFDYLDNLSFAKKYDEEVTSDLVTAIYDTERQIRIIGEDGAEKVIRVNKPIRDEETGRIVTLNDLSRGRFDISVTVGPSYTTQRMEAAEALLQLSNDPSPIGMVAKYGFLKSIDTPGLEDVKKAARKILVDAGLLEPEEGEQPPPPPQPNPKDIAGAEKDAAQALKYTADANRTNFETEREMLAMQMSLAPPLLPDPAAQTQPPQGGFFMGGDMYPPQ